MITAEYASNALKEYLTDKWCHIIAMLLLSFIPQRPLWIHPLNMKQNAQSNVRDIPIKEFSACLCISIP